MRIIITLLALLVFSGTALGNTYIVNPEGTGDFPTIQAAIDSAQAGDFIELADGTYTGDGNREIDYRGKAITVRSQSGIAHACMIDCEGLGRGFNFASGESAQSVLEDITVRNGSAPEGGAIKCDHSSPTISGCVFESNQASDDGGAIELYYSNSTIQRCIFVQNNAYFDGGAIECAYNSPHIRDCVFYQNTTGHGGYGAGAGIIFYQLQEDGDPAVAGCTFVEGHAWRGGGIFCDHNSTPTIENTIIAFGTYGEAIEQHSIDETPSLACCDLYGNVGGNWTDYIADQQGHDGNISQDPLFCNRPGGDFHLSPASPCGPYSPPNEECALIGALGAGCYRYACCLETGECHILHEDECGSLGGNWQVGVESCDPNPCVGACCLGSGECTVETADACAAYMGTYLGGGTDCSPNPCMGACCNVLECDECVIVTSETECNQGGVQFVFQGYGSTCDASPCGDLGACCLIGGCLPMTCWDCETASGVFEGPNTVCDPNPCPTSLVDESRAPLSGVYLSSPFPNPVMGTLAFQIELAEGSTIDLVLFDITGKVVNTFAENEHYAAGVHIFSLSPEGRDGSGLPAGIYYLRLEAGDLSQTRQIVVAH
ncbi:T9SS type A sorting domain-containing protein [Candidatus Eisenbacteria bacterium]|uniref:T9SS type A sorting domain-containing protein n=1 Tax=Eiseniibacteriota bacterium TaxID=2212470 RepID=A0ABV6YLD8_UNCEI